jgi:hypothetical protein
MEKNMDRFKNNYITFYESVSSIVSPEFWLANNPILPDSDNKKIELFVINWFPHMKEVSNGNISYFKDNKISPFIFENLKFLDLIDQLNLTNQMIVWEYLHSMYALSISNVEKCKENINDKELLESIQNSTSKFTEFISNMVSWRKEQKDLQKELIKDTKDTKDTKDVKLDDTFLENSVLAKLAKEISDEINPNDILNIGEDLKNMDNPMKLFQSILSGDKENGVGKLMTTVCGKLKNKMESGQINQDELIKEATNLLQNMGGMGGKSNPGQGSDLAGMMSMMRNLSSMSDLFGGLSENKENKENKVKKRMRRKVNKSKK